MGRVRCHAVGHHLTRSLSLAPSPPRTAERLIVVGAAARRWEPSMTDLATARMLARYDGWANRRLFDAVAALPEGEAAKQRPALFKSMIGTLNHNLVVALIWQAHIERR